MRQVLLPIAMIVVAVALAACGGGAEAEPTPARASPPPPPPAAGAPSGEAAPSAQTAGESGQGEGTTVTVINGDPGGATGAYNFVPSEQTFAVGETVTFVLKAESELHNFSIDDLGLDQDVNPGEEESVSVTFDTAGTYRFYCLFHEANGMEGTITVR